MENWQLDFEWLRIQNFLKETLQLSTLPDLNAALLFIGIQELGRWKKAFTKEEKQDLMHIATCRLLSYEDYYEFEGRDADGWPHWRSLRPFTAKGAQYQEQLLKRLAVRYFDEYQQN
ncbi:MAG: hypothetical protein KA974_01775 [Saprospiraceae bacterium]|nr:hypothetical protein [Saprospiraceae bacterium]MBP7680161.1 hypothetical protein [Saprospiraceae bacterium]